LVVWLLFWVLSWLQCTLFRDQKYPVSLLFYLLVSYYL
jgi:hypothetical protein